MSFFSAATARDVQLVYEHIYCMVLVVLNYLEFNLILSKFKKKHTNEKNYIIVWPC